MWNRISILVIFTLLVSTVFGQDYIECFPEQDDKKTFVYDEADILNDVEERQLRLKLEAFSDTTSNQILVITTNKLCGMVPAQYATRIGQHFGVGQADNDNGIVVLVAPEMRETFIAVGDGLEGAIPDITAGRVIDKEMLPRFREGKYYTGIYQATNVLMELASGEYSFQNYGSSNEVPGGVFIFLGIFLLIMIISISLAMRKARNYARLNNITIWQALALLSEANRKHTGSWGSFRGGSGGFGGFSGGGGSSFGGFGGGSFGGGGAGGSW